MGSSGSLRGASVRFGRFAGLQLGDAFQNQVFEIIEGDRVEVGTSGLLKVFEKLRQILDGLACGFKSHDLDLDAGPGSKEVEALEN
jgi:hypothetical protein